MRISDWSSDVCSSDLVYADWMQDEDYTGHGACRWQLMQFRVRMKATGTDGETRFVPNIMADELLAAEARNVYFNKVSYPSLGEGEFVNTGLRDRARFGPSIENGDVLKVAF